MKTPSSRNGDALACKTSNNLDDDKSNSAELSRRNLLGTSLVGVVGASTWCTNNEPAIAIEAANSKGPVAVIGASGRTGSLCVTAVRTTILAIVQTNISCMHSSLFDSISFSV